VGNDDKSISTIDAAGVALAAIQELTHQNQEMKKAISELKEENKELKSQFSDLQSALDKLVMKLEPPRPIKKN
jgi:FtsZ-binding cell division protein ZapB